MNAITTTPRQAWDEYESLSIFVNQAYSSTPYVDPKYPTDGQLAYAAGHKKAWQELSAARATWIRITQPN